MAFRHEAMYLGYEPSFSSFRLGFETDGRPCFFAKIMYVTSFVSGSSVRRVKKKRETRSRRIIEGDSEEGMPKKEHRESILWNAPRIARMQLGHKKYDEKEIQRRANVLRATWNQNNMVREILDYLKDYPDRRGRTEFLADIDRMYAEDEQTWKEMKDEDREQVRQLERNRKRRKRRNQEDQRIRSEELKCSTSVMVTTR